MFSILRYIIKKRNLFPDLARNPHRYIKLKVGRKFSLRIENLMNEFLVCFDNLFIYFLMF